MRFPFSLQRVFLILYSTERVFFYFLNVQVKSKAQFSLLSSWNSSMPYSRRDSFISFYLKAEWWATWISGITGWFGPWVIFLRAHTLEGRELLVFKEVWRFTFETRSSLKLTCRKIKCIWNNMHFIFVLKHDVYAHIIINNM